MQEQNLELSVTLLPILDVSNHVLYTGASPRRKYATAPPPQQQSGDETTLKRCLYHVFLRLPITHEQPPKSG